VTCQGLGSDGPRSVPGAIVRPHVCEPYFVDERCDLPPVDCCALCSDSLGKGLEGSFGISVVPDRR
jgi:hypothetical protein